MSRFFRYAFQSLAAGLVIMLAITFVAMAIGYAISWAVEHWEVAKYFLVAWGCISIIVLGGLMEDSK